jgi:hypothetical protein
MTDCPFAHECSKNDSIFCDSCRHKLGKKDHYYPMRPLNPDPWYPRPRPYNPIWINWRNENEYNKDYKLGPKPSPKLRTPFFLS